jgi:zinc transport system ATP-binding protein
VSDIVSFQNVDFFYGKNKVLENISFSFQKGDFSAIVGPNGGGKTTILKLITGLIKPDTGTIKVFDDSPGKNVFKIGYVPQFSVHDSSFPMEVEQVVMNGLLTPKSIGPFYGKKIKNDVKKILEKLGLSDRAKDRFGSLSGGLKQRTLIARAIVSKPDLLLLDEPVSSVDSSVEKDIFEMLNELNRVMTIVIVSHDIGFISGFVNKIACVNKTLVVNEAKDITLSNIDDLYKANQVLINHKCGI